MPTALQLLSLGEISAKSSSITTCRKLSQVAWNIISFGVPVVVSGNVVVVDVVVVFVVVVLVVVVVVDVVVVVAFVVVVVIVSGNVVVTFAVVDEVSSWHWF